MIPLPSTVARFVDKMTGQIIAPWVQYLQQFTINPPNIIDITLTGSPFSYEVKEPGNMFITGGTISAIHLIRGTKNLNVTGQKFIPVGIKDTVIVTYTVLPTMQFIPSYGQNTTL